MTYIQDLSIIFISILLEALPFILLGVLISSIIQVFVSDELIQKIIPKNPILGALVGVLMGLFIPTCDCAVIPVARRLIKKKVPLNVAITFMLASPIINPVVIIATIYSFNGTIPSMVLFRSLLGIIIAIVIGFVMSLLQKNDKVLLDNNKCSCDHDHCDCHNHEHEHEHHHNHENNKIVNKILYVLKHANSEFFDIIKYLIIGALIASCAQVFIPRDILQYLAQNSVISIIVFMLFAYLISLCSTSDSFVAKTFVNEFSNKSILAFLLLGPMIDIKNTIVLIGNFDKKFVLKLIGLIFLLIFIVSLFVTI